MSAPWHPGLPSTSRSRWEGLPSILNSTPGPIRPGSRSCLDRNIQSRSSRGSQKAGSPCCPCGRESLPGSDRFPDTALLSPPKNSFPGRPNELVGDRSQPWILIETKGGKTDELNALARSHENWIYRPPQLQIGRRNGGI